MAGGLYQRTNREHDFDSTFTDNDWPTSEKQLFEIGATSQRNKKPNFPSLPDELIQHILFALARSFPAPVVTTTLASCSLVSRQWYRLANPMLYASPVIDMGSKHRALCFLNRLVDELLQYELDLMDSVKREPKSNCLIDQMGKLMFIGEGRWRHRASFDNRPDVVDRSTLHEILNRLWCTKIESLVFVELPFMTPFHRPLVNRYPTSLSTLILLTPLSQFELLFVLRDLPTLNHLCIGSHDDTSSIPAEHHTLFNREQLPSPNLRSFGISARTLEAWLKTGMPWYETILNLVVIPSVRSITTLHLELADEDDERHLLTILGRNSSNSESSSLGSTRSSTRVDENGTEQLFVLENVFLRGLSCVLMAESLSRLHGIKKLCLSSIFGTALRCPNPTMPAIPHRVIHISIPAYSSTVDDNPDVHPASLSNATLNAARPPEIGEEFSRVRRTLSPPNPVWQSIPSSVEELSIDITRLPDHGPWNQRSSGQLAHTLTSLITSGQCPHLKKIGSLLSEISFEFGIHGPHGDDSPFVEFKEAAQNQRISLVPPFWNDSFVVNQSATHWYD